MEGIWDRHILTIESEFSALCKMAYLYRDTSPAPVTRVRFPIRIKITLPYLILSLVLSVAAAYLITQLVIENVNERFNKQIYEAGKISSELMVSYEDQLLGTERLLANAEGISTALQADDPESLRTLALGIVANDGQDAADFLDLSGNDVLSARHRPGGNPEDYAFSSGGQTPLSQLEIVKNVLSQKNDSRGDKFSDLVRTDAGDFLFVAGPVYDPDGVLAGVVMVGSSLPTLAADLHARTFAQITMYDPDGKVLYSTLPYPQDLTKDVASHTVSFQDVSSTKRNLNVSNIPFTEVLGAWEVRGNHNLGVLGIAVSQSEVVQTSAGSRLRIFLLVAITCFMIILVGINLGNSITRPLKQLVQAALKVSGGDLSVQVDMRTQDEFAILTESFNKMVTNLNQSHDELIAVYDSTLEGWAKALELKDSEVQGHSLRVTDLAVQLARKMGLKGDDLANFRRGALLHDIGKMGIPDSILHKPGTLNEVEQAIVRRHPQYAYDMLKQIDYLRPALDIPYCHHERWNGGGYPRGLKGNQIPLSARIFAVVDVYDAMTSNRPYRAAMPHEDVILYLKYQRGRHFDPQIVDAFLQMLMDEEI